VAGRPRKPTLTVAEILRWADAHKRRTGGWPSVTSGPVAGVPDLTWRAVDDALRGGFRGLPGGDSLARLLRRERGMAERRGVNKLNPGQRRLAARLRARGLPVAEVARRLGITRQGVYYLLRKAEEEGKQP
jgi:DNA-directed RNA polymerase specialized sigma24 family protein